jgi:DNA-binding response OmpR family regulator
MRNPGKFTHHIVVLDADPAILEYVRRILVDRFSVSLFTRAAELIRSLRGFPEPDLLLIDWHTAEDESEQNALGLLARTRALKPTLPIIMVACSAEPSDIVAATRMGATSVILKPFTKNEINLAVQQHLKLPCAQPVDPDIEGIRLNENTFCKVEQAHAGDRVPMRACSAGQYSGPNPRRERHGQGNCGDVDPQGVGAKPALLLESELRGDACGSA